MQGHLQTNVVCEPEQHRIANVFFSYGRTELNGTLDTELWAAGDRDITWVGQPHTVKANFPFLLYISTKYSDGERCMSTTLATGVAVAVAGACSSWWLQYKSFEVHLLTEMVNQVDADAVSRVSFACPATNHQLHTQACKGMDAELIWNEPTITLHQRQMITTVMTHNNATG